MRLRGGQNGKGGKRQMSFYGEWRCGNITYEQYVMAVDEESAYWDDNEDDCDEECCVDESDE